MDYNKWLKYHKGKLLLLSNRAKEARDYIIPIVRSNKNESWSWNILSHTFINENTEKSIACLCKALSINKDEKFFSNIRLDLAKLLILKGDYSSAKYEINKIIEYKNSQGYKIGDDLTYFINCEWYKNIELKESNEILYNDYKPIAEEIYLESLEWENAIITKVISKNEFLIISNKYLYKEIYAKNVDLSKLDQIKEGLPVYAKIDRDNSNPLVLSINIRESELWDLLESYDSVIERIFIEEEKARIIIYVSLFKQFYSYANFNDFELLKRLSVGDSLSVKGFSFTTKENQSKFIICKINRNNSESSNLIKQHIGAIKIDEVKKFGFIDEYFVNPELIVENNIIDGSKIKCLLIYSLNKKKKKDRNRRVSEVKEWGWKVLKIIEIIREP